MSLGFQEWDEYTERLRCPRKDKPKDIIHRPGKDAQLVAIHSVIQVMFWLYKAKKRRLTTATGNEIYITRTLKLFKFKGVDCVECGLEGKFFIEWKTTGASFLQLYGFKEVKKGTKFILMTADHIFPKSKGGHQGYCNLQPMCAVCNNKKGNKIIKQPKIQDILCPVEAM